MKAKLMERAWTTSGTQHCIVTSNARTAADIPLDLQAKSSTGRTGLRNLGNTCYLNSFVQSLFLTDPFRQKIITAPLLPKPVFSQFQRVLAFMILTQRRAISPHRFIEVANFWLILVISLGSAPIISLRASARC